MTKDVLAMYDLTSVTSPPDSNFQAISFLGYQGTFNENTVIAFEQTQLKSSRYGEGGPGRRQDDLRLRHHHRRRAGQ